MSDDQHSGGAHSSSSTSKELKAQLKAVKKAERADKGWFGRHRLAAVGVAALALLGTLAALTLLGSEASGPDYEALSLMEQNEFRSIDTADWSAIKKNPVGSIGKKIIVFADINQFDQATGDGEFLGDASALQPAEESEYDSNTLFRGDPKLLSELAEEDVVRVHGVVSGSSSYENTMGGGTDAVQVDVARIEKVGLYDLRKDVKILESRPTDEWGDWSVELKVTNSAAVRKEYSVTITAKSADGSKDIEESSANTSKLEPGASVTVETSQFLDAEKDSKLVVDDVSRY